MPVLLWMVRVLVMGAGRSCCRISVLALDVLLHTLVGRTVLSSLPNEMYHSVLVLGSGGGQQQGTRGGKRAMMRSAG